VSFEAALCVALLPTSPSLGRFIGAPHHLQGRLDTKVDSSGCGKVKFSLLHAGQLIIVGSFAGNANLLCR